MNHLAEALQDKATAVAFGVAGLCIVLLLSTSLRTGSLAKFPLNSSQYGSYPKRLMNYVYHAEEIYRQGYKECKNTVYRITTVDGDRLVLPSALLDELRLRPDHEINSTEVMYTSVEGKYTGLPRATPFLNNIVRADLTRNLPRLNARLSEEVDRSVNSEMPQCDDWTSVVITEKLLRIVAIVSGHIFLGPDLCRREEYIDASINFTVNVFKAVRALKRWPKIVRPIIQYFIPELRRLRAHREKSKQFLIPIIQERKVLMKEGKDLPDDLLQWMLNKSDETNHYDDGEMAFMQLLLSMAAIHTTSMTTTNILYDIVAHPEVIPLLREEIQSVLKETDGVMNTTALFHMKLLDSVMRESQRVNPLSMVRFARYVEKPVTLKDGTTLPPGVVIEAPHVCITRDPELYPDPNTFDPYRFYHLRSGEREDPIGYKTTEQYQFVTVTKENMSFGLGRHACPGRFFAANEIKLILARMLLEFDFSMPEGQEKRFDNIIMAHSMVPDPKREILVRRVNH